MQPKNGHLFLVCKNLHWGIYEAVIPGVKAIWRPTKSNSNLSAELR